MEQLDLLNQECAEIQTITTREGKVIDISGDVWHLPYNYYANASIDFAKIQSQSIKQALKNYVSKSLRVTSTHAGFSDFGVVTSEIMKFFDYKAVEGSSEEEILINAFEMAINEARKERRLWALYRSIEWYKWNAKNYPELGFSGQYSQQLSTIKIVNNPKGQAVRMEDPTKGPFDKSLELPLLINALKKDTDTSFRNIQERAALALSIALGRNPANLTLLRESDLSKLNPFDKDDPCYVLKMPRIKKRQLNTRDDFIDEYLDPYFGKIIEELIAANESIKLVYAGRRYTEPSERPLFIRLSGNSAAKNSHSFDEIFNMVSNDISKLLKSFVKRHNIISPLTELPLEVSTRRFRYTLATGLASEGVNTEALAKILDHSDTQSVLVYYDTKGSIVTHLDKALSSQFAQYVSLFSGQIIDSENSAINGNRHDKHLSFVDENLPNQKTDIGICGESSICHLDPPFSCYLCPKFQPYRSANHEYVLENLLKGREKRLKIYESSRLGIQLDDVILAVSNVIHLCKEI
ncbi:site-specific integrase [Psychrobacter immobilis]|uniref:site-specific integrase n=1 Tax=Psychrobacter immobilis TaxID=498 RepID=UPI00191B3EAD|nr:site-specific integrase [Psychrobacter immobilis]